MLNTMQILGLASSLLCSSSTTCLRLSTLHDAASKSALQQA